MDAKLPLAHLASSEQSMLSKFKTADLNLFELVQTAVETGKEKGKCTFKLYGGARRP
jgi:chemotaxis receptor (MCP) glutamine deamidase CheD